MQERQNHCNFKSKPRVSSTNFTDLSEKEMQPVKVGCEVSSVIGEISKNLKIRNFPPHTHTHFGILRNKNIVHICGIRIFLVMNGFHCLTKQHSFPIKVSLLFPLQDGGHGPFYGM